MKEVHTGRATRAALQSATSTWQTIAKHDRPPIQIAAGHLAREQTLDSALDEYCQLRERDKSLTASQFCDRYPSYRHSLRRLIDVQDALEHQPALEEENWPGVFTEFLGYEILHELGVGAIARVYLAAETALGGRLVAIKVSHQGGYEAETLGKLTHPNVVPVFSVKHEEESDMTAVCMPYHGSATLADLLEVGFADGKPPATALAILAAAREREQVADFLGPKHNQDAVAPVLLRGTYVDGVAWLGLQMGEALAYTHERGVLHRDLKPSNILLTPKGVPMLLDFNLASDIETGMQRLGGTLPYMPPEQIRDVHLQPFEADLSGDPRSDIFSLGVILYELLTGKLPFGDPPACVAPRQAAEEYLSAQQQIPQPVRDLNPQVTSEFAQLIHACLALDPGERPASAADFVDVLKKYFTPQRRVRRWTSRHRGLVTVLAVLFMLTGFAAVWHLATRPPLEIRQYKAGVIDFQREQFRDAIEHFTRALEVNPNSDAYRFARGLANQRLGDHDTAYSDLKRLNSSDDPAVLECIAYSAAQTRGGDTTARAHYGKLCEKSPSDAAMRLNHAYACYRAPAYESSAQAANGANGVITLRPDWKAAYHLGALANRHRVILAGRRINNTRDSVVIGLETRERKKSIEMAVQLIDRALELESDDPLLVRDAIMIHTMPGVVEDVSRIRQLYELAADLRFPRQTMQSLSDNKPWNDADWFQDLLQRCQEGGELEGGSMAERFLTPPPTDLAVFLLDLGRHESLVSR
ncbi:MAG TPA: protein kinase [Pirellulaceae bacterium]|nr:protein kinase [Pirellulaceae bacterium]